MPAYKPLFRVLHVDWVQQRSNKSSERNRNVQNGRRFQWEKSLLCTSLEHWWLSFPIFYMYTFWWILYNSCTVIPDSFYLLTLSRCRRQLCASSTSFPFFASGDAFNWTNYQYFSLNWHLILYFLMKKVIVKL